MFLEMKRYCSTSLPYVSEQPLRTEQLPAAMFEANALAYVRGHGSEIEWSQQAAAAQRSRQVGIGRLSVTFFSIHSFIIIG